MSTPHVDLFLAAFRDSKPLIEEFQDVMEVRKPTAAAVAFALVTLARFAKHQVEDWDTLFGLVEQFVDKSVDAQIIKMVEIGLKKESDRG